MVAAPGPSPGVTVGASPPGTKTKKGHFVMILQKTYGLIRSAKEIRAALEADGERIGVLLNERRSQPADESVPVTDFRAQMRHLSYELDVTVEQVVVSEDDNSERQIKLDRLRDELEDSVNTNYQKLVATRDGLESIFPNGAYELAFISGTTPRVPLKLVEQLAQTAKLLRDPPVALRETKNPAFSADLEIAASHLEAGIPELRELIDRVDTSRKQTVSSQVVRRKAIEDLHRTIIWVGRTSEGLFYLAKEDELAKRIRSSTRRSKRPSEEAAEQAKAAEASSNDEVPSESESSESPSS